MNEFKWVKFSEKKPNIGDNIIVKFKENYDSKEYKTLYLKCMVNESYITLESFESSDCCGCSPNKYLITKKEYDYTYWSYISEVDNV